MKLNRVSYLACILFFFSNFVVAAQDQAAELLKVERDIIIKQYIMDLQRADYQHISQLFDSTGIVVSTSRGKVNAKEFFYAFLPHIESANTKINQTFISDMDNNRYAARFHFTFKLKDGEKGDGEYVDEFVFADHSTKLIAVYMFENLKFPEVKN